MTTLKWLAAISLVLALVCRFTLKQIALGLATSVTPTWHREVISATLGVVLFWGLLVLSVALGLFDYLKHNH